MIPIQIKCTNAEIPLEEMREIESCFFQAFDRFDHFIREAHLTLRDTNGQKGGIDKLCTIQLRFYPRGLAVVKSGGTSFLHAANLACDKMQQVATKRLGKRKSGPQKKLQSDFKGEQVYEN